MEEEWFGAVHGYPDIILREGYVLGCLFLSSFKCVFGDGGVVVYDVELDEGCIVFVSYSSEPFRDGPGVLPLVEL